MDFQTKQNLNNNHFYQLTGDTLTLIGNNNVNIPVGNGLSKSGNIIRLGGILTGATSIGLGSNILTFTATTGTIKYGSDLSANYTSRSLVDKGYITGNTILATTNGLKKVGINKVGLGGILTGATTIGLGSNILTFTASTGTLKYGGNYSANFTARSLVDKGYVTGNTIIAAGNGLTKVGNKLKLGGTLTATTLIETTSDFYFGVEWPDDGFSNGQGLFYAGGATGFNSRTYGLGEGPDLGPDPVAFTELTGIVGFISISSVRTATGENARLNFNSNNGSNGIDVQFVDDRSIKRGIEYAADYSTGFTKYSLVDKNFVTGNTNNGLSYSTGGTLGLGGKLQKYTTYIYADPNGTPSAQGYPPSIWFGVSGQTQSPTGDSLNLAYYPLGAVSFHLSGASTFSTTDNVARVSDVGLNFNGAYFDYYGADGANYFLHMDINSISLYHQSSGGTDTASSLSLNDGSAFLSTNGASLQIVNNDHIALTRFNTGGSQTELRMIDRNITIIPNNTGGSAMYFDSSGTTLLCNTTSQIGGFAITDSTSSSNRQRARASGQASFVMGRYAEARGKYSFVGGQGFTSASKYLLATGVTSFNFSENNTTQTAGHGALATQCFILGGVNHNIPNTSPRAGILGGNTIKASSGVPDTIYMPKVRIGRGTGGSVSTLITGSTIVGMATSTGELGSIRVGNGVTFTNGMLKLGGVLSGATTIGLTSNSITFTGTTGTLRYGSDLSANYNVRSLIDKGYATGSTLYLAENGLTKVNNNKVKLGGTVTGATTIGLGSNNLIFTASTGTLRYGSDLSASYNVRSIVDKGYATGNTLYLAENGLTKINNNKVKLGGNITGATTIGLAANNLTFTASTGTIRYGSDLSANYNVRSLVDKGYVTGLTSTLVTLTGATNGLTVTGKKVKLGGSLTGTTTIDATTFGFTQTGTSGQFNIGRTTGSINLNSRNSIVLNGKSNVGVDRITLKLSATGATFTDARTGTTATGLRYGANYSSNYNVRSLVDKGYATGSTLYLAENGLTKVNNNKVKLGGTVTGDTFVQTSGNAGMFFANSTNSVYMFAGDVLNGLAPLASVFISDPNTIQLLISDVNTGTNSYSESITIDTSTLNYSSNVSQVNVGNSVASSNATSYIQNIDTASGRNTLFESLAVSTGSEITFSVTDNSSKTTFFGLSDNSSTKGIRVTLPSTGHTFQYTSDYSSSYKVRSLVDKGYVTGNTFTKSSATFGHKTLTGGTAVVSTTAIAAGSIVILTIDGGTQTNAGTVRVSARSAGSNFTITSSNILDTSQVGWVIFN